MTQHRPNQALRSCLAELGWSPEQLARRLTSFARGRGVAVRVSDKAPYHWLNGARPRPPLPDLVAELLRDTLARRVTASDLGWAAASEPGGAVTGQGPVGGWAPGGTLTALEGVLDPDRIAARDPAFTAISEMAVIAAASHWLLDVDRLTRAGAGLGVDMAVVGELERVVDAHRRMEDLLGGRLLYGAVREQLRFVTGLLKNGIYTEQTGMRLYGIAAELACLTGWLWFDSDDPRRAQRAWLAALQAAQLAGDRALGAHILLFQAEQAAGSGDYGTAITILDTAHTGARTALGATQQAALCARQALAYAHTGQPRLAEAAAQDAFTLLSQTRPAEDPAWIYWCGQGDVNYVVGQSYLALPNTGKAIAHLQTAVSRFGPERPRDQTLAMALLARAHLTAGERDRALQIARDATTLAAQTDSHQATHAITGLHHQLG